MQYLLDYELPIIAVIILWFIISVISALRFRVVVPTNEVHIVQSRKKTTSFGKDQADGNSYYRWPAWVPVIGIRVITLPVSVFDVKLDNYAAYDKGRVPFVIDILAFFRIENSNQAAQRVSSFAELEKQLEGILQGASRSILAQSPIEEILEERAKYGQAFTDATDTQLKAWGVANVKNIELMDIRDAQGSETIKNIMAVKQSTIAKDSRIAVANNMQAAQTAEISADQLVKIKQQDADEQVGKRKAEKDKQIGIAGQQAQQAIKDEEKTTAEKTMAIAQVNQVRTAEISKEAAIVLAEQKKSLAIIESEGARQHTINVADGTLEQAKREAEATQIKGQAEGAAQTAVLMAPVEAQTKLAERIGQNQPYQSYLITIRRIEAEQAIGIEQARALDKADVKIIANTGANVLDGAKSAVSLFSPSVGLNVGAALEALKQTPAGEALVDGLVGALPNGNASGQAPRAPK